MKKSVALKTTQRRKVSNLPRFWLQLYISGATLRSAQAIANIKAISEKRLSGRYNLEVIDIGQQAALARAEQIVVLPTLIKQLPLPTQRVIGNLSDTGQVLLALGLAPQEPDDTEPDR